MMEMDKKRKRNSYNIYDSNEIYKKGNRFCFPDVEDTGTHKIKDVVFCSTTTEMWHYFEKC